MTPGGAVALDLNKKQSKKHVVTTNKVIRMAKMKLYVDFIFIFETGSLALLTPEFVFKKQ